MADISTNIDPEQRPEPDKPVLINRTTVLTVVTTSIAVLFLGLNLKLRGFSKEAKTCDGHAELDLRQCYAAKSSGSRAAKRRGTS